MTEPREDIKRAEQLERLIVAAFGADRKRMRVIQDGQSSVTDMEVANKSAHKASDAIHAYVANTVREAVEAEREACALLVWEVESIPIEDMHRNTSPLRRAIADRIRARSSEAGV